MSGIANLSNFTVAPHGFAIENHIEVMKSYAGTALGSAAAIADSLGKPSNPVTADASTYNPIGFTKSEPKPIRPVFPSMDPGDLSTPSALPTANIANLLGIALPEKADLPEIPSNSSTSKPSFPSDPVWENVDSNVSINPISPPNYGSAPSTPGFKATLDTVTEPSYPSLNTPSFETVTLEGNLDLESFEPIEVPTLPDYPLPSLPSFQNVSVGTIEAVSVAKPSFPSLSSYTVPSIPNLSPIAAPAKPGFKDISQEGDPSISLVNVPSLQGFNAVTVPAVPDMTFTTTPAKPVLSTIVVPALPVISLPTFDLTPISKEDLIKPVFSFNYVPSNYMSATLTKAISTLLSRLDGGTGINPLVEEAIWARGLDREVRSTLLAEKEHS